MLDQVVFKNFRPTFDFVQRVHEELDVLTEELNWPRQKKAAYWVLIKKVRDHFICSIEQNVGKGRRIDGRAIGRSPEAALDLASDYLRRSALGGESKHTPVPPFPRADRRELRPVS